MMRYFRHLPIWLRCCLVACLFAAPFAAWVAIASLSLARSAIVFALCFAAMAAILLTAQRQAGLPLDSRQDIYEEFRDR